MKKLLTLLMMVVFAVGMVACGSDKDNNNEGNDNANNQQEENNGNNAGNGNEDANNNGNEDNSGNENAEGDAEGATEKPGFQEFISLLEAEGLEVEVQAGNEDVPDYKDSINLVVNGEDMLLVEIYEMEADSDNLKQAHENGEVTVVFEGMEGELPAKAKGNYVFLLAEGHPDLETIENIIDNDFKGE